MTAVTLGGGSSAVAASSHAACERFRGTDPMITKRTRRQLARELGHPDTSGTIPEARWMRAKAFERLVRDDVRPSIIDPHGQHLEDSLVKLQGLAKFAERYGDGFHRIETMVKDGAKWRVLDLKRADVRSAIAEHTESVVELYSLRGLYEQADGA